MYSSNSSLNHWVLCGSLSNVGYEEMRGIFDFSHSVKGRGNVMESWKNYKIDEREGCSEVL